MSTPDLALTESKTLRAQYAEKTDVLDKVKALTLLPDGVHATTEMVARYFDVTPDVINKLMQRHRGELTDNGLRVVTGKELEELKKVTSSVINSRRLALFTRRTILNVGQLLTESQTAEQIRKYLLDVEELAPAELRDEAIKRAAVSRAQLRMIREADGYLDAVWIAAKMRVIVARGLGEEPEIDALDRPLYVPDYLREKGVNSKRELTSIQSWFGRRVAGLCEAAGMSLPERRTSELTNGTLRETTAWTERHRPLFDEVWDRWYAAEYDDRPAVLV